ncbi:MAG: hypothetical protein INH41_02800 [Myxococcaceae bacterium]|nr:hypothetical protein [Myxococcaceae bacterium]
MPPAAALLVVLAGLELTGPPVLHDGLSVRPPRAFRLARMDLFHGTRVTGEAAAEGVSRYLSAALMDGDGEDAASMLVSVVEAPLEPGPNARDEAATNVTRHLRDELGLDFVLERADVVTGGAARVEVRGQVREGAQLRKLLVARFFGAPRHAVVVFSVPSGRWDALGPALLGSLDSLRMDQPSGTPRLFAWALAVLVGAALLISMGLWRLRQGRRNAR